MQVISSEKSYFTKPCESYIFVGHLPSEVKASVRAIQEKLSEKFGSESFWFPEANALHITITHIISPDGNYSEPVADIYKRVGKEATLAFERSISGVKAPMITFDAVRLFNNAIIIQGHDDGTIQQIRNKFKEYFSLPDGTRTPPAIIHSTIARYTAPLNLEMVQDFAQKELAIDATFRLEGIDLASEEKIFMQKFSTLKHYTLES